MKSRFVRFIHLQTQPRLSVVSQIAAQQHTSALFLPSQPQPTTNKTPTPFSTPFPDTLVPRDSTSINLNSPQINLTPHSKYIPSSWSHCRPLETRPRDAPIRRKPQPHTFKLISLQEAMAREGTRSATGQFLPRPSAAAARSLIWLSA